MGGASPRSICFVLLDGTNQEGHQILHHVIVIVILIVFLSADVIAAETQTCFASSALVVFYIHRGSCNWTFFNMQSFKHFSGGSGLAVNDLFI